MGIAGKYNKGSRFEFKATEGFEYKKLEELYKEGEINVLPVMALYINTKGKFGDRPLAVTANCFVNLPNHMLDTVKAMLADDELIEAINKGMVAMEIYKYHDSTYDKDCYSVNWVDADLPF